MTEKRFPSYSQIGQDLLANHVLRYMELPRQSAGPRRPFALELGAFDREQLSNTLLLEMIGWNGLAVDINQVDWTGRLMSFECMDLVKAGRTGLTELLDRHMVPVDTEFASFDIEDGTIGLLLSWPFERCRPAVVCYEHNFYNFRNVGQYHRGPEDRFISRDVMHGFGYQLLCADVCINGLPFEDWWVDTRRVDTNRLKHLAGIELAEGYELVRIMAMAEAVYPRVLR